MKLLSWQCQNCANSYVLLSLVLIVRYSQIIYPYSSKLLHWQLELSHDDFTTASDVILRVWVNWLNADAVRCRYNAVDFITNIHKRHPMARPLGRGMGCPLWIQHPIDNISQFLQLLMQNLTILDRVKTLKVWVVSFSPHQNHHPEARSVPPFWCDVSSSDKPQGGTL